MKHFNEKHGMEKHPLYNTWNQMRQRCLNPKSDRYRNYGARGIKICDAWVNDPAAFIAYIGPRPSRRHSLDRIDNDGHYEPGNVRWNDDEGQGQNRTSNKLDIWSVRFIKYWLFRRYKQRDIAKSMGVTPGQISHIKFGRQWRNVR